MRQEQGEDWIEYMADQVHLNYKGRKVVIWGSYGVADSIQKKLETKYGINTAFYVDGDRLKVDGRKVLSLECLDGMSNQYYVVVPIAFYPAVRERLARGGYEQDVDCCYFCDCAIRQEADYYEDAHGNKIIGNYQGLKFAFSGFHSVIRIGKGVRFREAGIYLHNGVEVRIGDEVRFEETSIHLCNGAELSIGNETQLEGSNLALKDFSKIAISKEAVLQENHVDIGKCSAWEIDRGCQLVSLYMIMNKEADVVFGEDVKIIAYTRGSVYWDVGNLAKVEIGGGGCFSGFGNCSVGETASLRIGEGFTIGENYQISVGEGTNITIGKDCMFSRNIFMGSNDAHSIFDVETGNNINSTHDIAKGRSIVIGNHVWGGNYSCILYHTQIGDGSIIGAMSLVKGKIPNNCTAAGNPARVIRKNIAWSRENGAEDIGECGREYVRYTEEASVGAKSP